MEQVKLNLEELAKRISAMDHKLRELSPGDLQFQNWSYSTDVWESFHDLCRSLKIDSMEILNSSN